ncbi:long-chain-fatty-acid--CoA ligase ACSBG2-like isoform X2 [Heptranchias perlo]
MGELLDSDHWLNDAGGDTTASLRGGKNEEKLQQSINEKQQEGFIDQVEMPLGMKIKNDSPGKSEQVTSPQKGGSPTNVARLGDFNSSNSARSEQQKKAELSKNATARGGQAGTSSSLVERNESSAAVKVTPVTPYTVHMAPATELWTTEKNGAVKIRMEDSGYGAELPLTVNQVLQQAVESYGKHVALAFKQRDRWEKMNYEQYYNACRRAAKSFLKLGLQRFHGVGILGFNSPEWFIADIGAILAGGLAVGIYTTNSPEACKYVAHNCEANVLVVENHKQLQKILEIRSQLPQLKAIVQYKDELEEQHPDLYSWTQFMELGNSITDAELDEIIDSQKVNHCCMLIYTSGTTGSPKGVMLSHDNVTWTANSAGIMVGITSEAKDRVVSFLPLSHIAAQMMDVWIPIRFGATTYFADADALKGSLVNTLKEVRPTAFLGVPRVWEKIQEKMKETSAKSSAMKRKIAVWAKTIGLQTSYNIMNGEESVPWGFFLANRLVFKKVRDLLGLDQCMKCFTGAAPITKETLEFFLSLRITLYELYGMSESTGPHTVSYAGSYRITSCGKEMFGCQTKIDKPDDQGTGELCFWGRHVFMGYLNMTEQTKEALDAEGWLHSGDLGKHDKDGFLYITGRIKELIITAGGENIPPIPIEDAVKEKLPIVSNAMLIGDKKKFLSMLLTLKCNVDNETGDPLDEMTAAAVAFCHKHGSPATLVSEVVSTKDTAVYKAIQAGIDAVNKKATSNTQKIQKWVILEKDFSVVGGELGPTMKLKRPIVVKMYKDEIEALYLD